MITKKVIFLFDIFEIETYTIILGMIHINLKIVFTFLYFCIELYHTRMVVNCFYFDTHNFVDLLYKLVKMKFFLPKLLLKIIKLKYRK